MAHEVALVEETQELNSTYTPHLLFLINPCYSLVSNFLGEKILKNTSQSISNAFIYYLNILILILAIREVLVILSSRSPGTKVLVGTRTKYRASSDSCGV